MNTHVCGRTVWSDRLITNLSVTLVLCEQNGETVGVTILGSSGGICVCVTSVRTDHILC